MVPDEETTFKFEGEDTKVPTKRSGRKPIQYRKIAYEEFRLQYRNLDRKLPTELLEKMLMNCFQGQPLFYRRG
ncbi:hypothetical protein WA026_001290 [Henosepilachna vigintioctopunctata]|uniref:Uncharacterized protein n=1 Tax=Henosepilachna vigintioctopunctata TaxID=420089 RepID=A0AAW1UK39_9CUCU